MINKVYFKFARKLHKWLGYLLALQLLFWLLGGLVMSAIPLDKVHGKHLAQRNLDNPFFANDYTAPLNPLMQQHRAISNIQFSHRLNEPIIIIESEQGRTFYQGVTGSKLAPATLQQIKRTAMKHYLGNGKIIKSQLLKQGPREVGYKQNIWYIEFEDFFNTALYIDPISAQIVTVRSTIWRIFDFFWMLHIMDYDEREDFNNPLLISFSAVAVLFCLSGILLLMQNIRLRKFKRL